MLSNPPLFTRHHVHTVDVGFFTLVNETERKEPQQHQCQRRIRRRHGAIQLDFPLTVQPAGMWSHSCK